APELAEPGEGRMPGLGEPAPDQGEEPHPELVGDRLDRSRGFEPVEPPRLEVGGLVLGPDHVREQGHRVGQAPPPGPHARPARVPASPACARCRPGAPRSRSTTARRAGSALRGRVRPPPGTPRAAPPTRAGPGRTRAGWPGESPRAGGHAPSPARPARRTPR